MRLAALRNDRRQLTAVKLQDRLVEPLQAVELS